MTPEKVEPDLTSKSKNFSFSQIGKILKDIKDSEQVYALLLNIIKNQTIFQEWTVQLLKSSDDWDLIVLWEEKIKEWEKELLIVFTDETNEFHLNVNQKSKHLDLWQEFLQKQIRSAQELHNSTLDVLTQKILQFTPITLVEEMDTYSKFYSLSNNK